jgi:hypothetical protein
VGGEGEGEEEEELVMVEEEDVRKGRRRGERQTRSAGVATPMS